jgi:hypothetical protein
MEYGMESSKRNTQTLKPQIKIKQKMRIEELNEDVEDVGEFNEMASEMVDEYCHQLETQDGMKKDMTDDEKWACDDNGWAFMWSDKANRLINEEIDRMTKIGQKYFDEFDVEVNPMMFKED